MKRLGNYSPLVEAGTAPVMAETETVYQNYEEAVITHTPTGRRFLVNWLAMAEHGHVVYRVRKVRETTRDWQELTCWDYRYWTGSKYSDPDLLLDAAEEIIVDSIRQERHSPEAA